MTPDPSPSHDGRWTRRQVAAAAFVVTFLGLGIGVPAAKLLERRPARFGWQMYAAVDRPPVFRLQYPDSLVLAGYAAPGWHRRDMHLEDVLPARLCRENPAALAVHVQLPPPEPARVHPCR